MESSRKISPFKATMTVRGKDARRFLAKLEEDKNKKVDPARLREICESAKRLRAIMK